MKLFLFCSALPIEIGQYKKYVNLFERRFSISIMHIYNHFKTKNLGGVLDGKLCKKHL